MNKSLINAALLGLLVVAAPASSFMSCKDYDEDLNLVKSDLAADKANLVTVQKALQDQLEALKTQQTAAEKQIADLKKDIATLKADDEMLKLKVSALETEVAKIAVIEGKIATLEQADKELRQLLDKKVDKDQYAKDLAEINAKLGAVNTELATVKATAETTKGELAALKADLKGKADFQLAVLDAFKKQVEDQLKDIATKANIEALNTRVAALETSVATAQQEVAKLKEAVAKAATKEELKQLEDQVKALNEKVAKIDARLAVLEAAGGLKSLVLEPENYYQGIEAIEGDSYDFKSWKVSTKQSADKLAIVYAAPTEDAGAVSVSPEIDATYHINPTNATLKTDAKNYQFFVLNRINRAAQELIKPEVKSASVKDGKVTVKFKVNNGDKNLTGQGKNVTVVALNYSEEGVSVTSDYAVLYTSKYKKFELHNAATAREGATAETALATNIAGAATIEVKWDGKVDLKEWVNTYRVDEANVAGRWDKNAAEGLVEKSGFKYEYQLIQNGTADKAYQYLTVDEKGVATPHMPGTTDQSISEVGQTPYVRVILRYADNDKVAAVGYYKIVITGKDDFREILPAKTDAYTMVCADDDKVFEGQYTIAGEQLQDILKKTAITETEFWAQYEYEKAGANVQQYELKNDNTFATATGKGKVVADATGKKLTWTLTEAEKTIVKAGDEQATWVKIKNKAGNPVNFYVKLTWKPSAVNNTPSVAFDLENRTPEYWFQNVNVANEKEVRMHVNLSNTDKFSYDLNDAFKGNKPKVSALVAPYAKFNDQVKGNFKFVEPRVKTAKGSDNKTYELSVSENGDQFLANEAGQSAKTVVAKLDKATGVVTLENNDVAKVLLNYASHNLLKDGQTLTARVGFEATICEGKKDVAVTGSEFDVKFLRPIDVTGEVNLPLTDAVHAKIEVPAKFQFEDWRNIKFNASTDGDLYKLYGVQAIKAHDKKEWTTTLGGNKLEANVTLESVNKNVELEFVAPTAPIAQDNFGKVVYTTPDNVLQKFTVRIPVTVTYKWGDVETFLDVVIGRTTENAPRK